MVKAGTVGSPSISSKRLAIPENTAGEQRDAIPEPSGRENRQGFPPMYRIIVVDDEPKNRALCRHILEPAGIACDEAADGLQGLKAVTWGNYDLVLLDVDMPKMQGPEVLRRLRENPPSPHLKIVMISGRASDDEMALMLRAGADDYLSKPFSPVQLRERVKASLRLKVAQQRSELLNRKLLEVNQQQEQVLLIRDSDLIQARNALVLGLAEMVGQRDAETGAHLTRLRDFARCLAQEAAQSPGFAEQIDDNFLQMLGCCTPLHDIGKVGVPDSILQKPGKLTDEERLVMQKHTVFAAATLQKVAEAQGFGIAFFQIAVEIARHHHERFDGNGYPDRLAGGDIPLSARIVAIADVYDALRSKRIYKPALPHSEAVRIMLEDVGHFDPFLLAAFQRCCGSFERIFQQITN